MNTTTVFDTPESIQLFHLLSIKYALKLESIGLRHSKGSVATRVRKMIGSKTRNKQELLVQYTSWLEHNLPAQR